MNSYLKYFVLPVVAAAMISCDDKNKKDDGGGQEYDYSLLIKDSKYERGFQVTSTDESNHQVQGTLKYGGTAISGTPVWMIGQWNNLNNDILKATYKNTGSVHEYKTDGGNRVVSDTDKGTITLELNTTSEYGLNGITSNPRKENEPWPTLLLQCSMSDQEILKIADKEEIRMDVDYNVTKVEDKMASGTVNRSLHSAQFQWFVTIQNRTMGSKDYGRYIWFGLCFYDKRYDFTPEFAAEDGGKEQNTGAFIYMPDMSQILSGLGKTVVGQAKHVDVDILPIVRSAFKLAQQRKYLLNTTWEDLYIGSMNIGWEVPGTYNVAVQINSLNIKYR